MTVPLLAPVLSVVFITMIINVLKVFDLVITLAPGSSQNAANVIALAMWRTSFGGINDFGVGSAIAVFLFVLVVPVLAPQHQALQEGAVTDVAVPSAIPSCVRSRAVGAGHGRRRSSSASRCAAPVNLFLSLLGLLWLDPDARALPHLDPAGAGVHGEGLVADLLQAEPRHLVELQQRPPQPLDHALARGSRAEIAVGNTLIVIVVGALAGYAFAWLEFPGPRLDLHRRDRRCSSCRCRWR